jgi:ABC-type branched-subunit amino acid transport system ATPase component
MADNLLEVRNLVKSFGGVVPHDDICIDIPCGMIAGLIGPNGSGKTTLFNSITGQHPVDSGSIKFEGRELLQLTPGEIARRGLVRTFQDGKVYHGMTCIQNMRISTSHAGESPFDDFALPPRAIDERAMGMLDFVGLHDKRDMPAGELSFGQCKLLEFGMALMCAPKLLLLDEPTAGIHPRLIDSIVDRLQRANAELGVTLLVIEHNMEVIMNIAGRIYCLDNGRVLAHGTPREISSNQSVIDAYLGAHA